MADASPVRADRPGPDPASPSDEEDFGSSQSTVSVNPDTLGQRQLANALDKLRLEQATPNQNYDHSATRTSTPGTGASVQSTGSTGSRQKPLQLLELPLDILKCIIKEVRRNKLAVGPCNTSELMLMLILPQVTHTNDLTSLALTCSTLHNLSIPHMYSRFDIVWPESLNSTTDDYAGVDALSYGLSTLVMGEDVFHQLPFSSSGRWANVCSHCGCNGAGHHSAPQPRDAGSGFQSRRGNYYAQYTRTFSIGNGPLSWVQEYSVNREVGKMLGTLVALAVARMVNLEAFIWDMPTGVVREIWFALASLANRQSHECRLERIWVRWHDNSENSGRLLSSPLSTTLSYLQMYRGVEHPSLSVLPPLKSVTVLDIDEPAYAEELAILIERSRKRLIELRIGIAAKSHRTGWTKCQKNDRDQLGSTGPWPKAGGVLSILSKHDPEARLGGREWLASMGRSEPSGPQTQPASVEGDKTTEDAQTQQVTGPPPDRARIDRITEQRGSPNPADSQTGAGFGEDDRLNLEVLELERVPLSVSNLLPTIDWTRLTTLTLMQCDDHEQLWRALRRKYAPPAMSPKRLQHGDQRHGNATQPSIPEYSLSIKHLRTDTVSPYMMLFIKDALAPNTLESVYLHEAPDYEASVHIDAIYKHILRKHRLSLRKVLVDASERDATADGMSTRWHKWMFNHEMISFVTSGRMPQLRELGLAMRYRDWVRPTPRTMHIRYTN